MSSEKRRGDDTIKRCSRDPSHIWMADIGFCPYCNLSAEARIAGMATGKRDKDEASMFRLGVEEDRRKT